MSAALVKSVGDARSPQLPEERAYGFSPSIVTLSNPTGVVSETIRALRTHVQSQHFQGGRRGLAICGPSREVGTTFVAVNLAVSLARIGITTLLIDANMREPGIERYITPTTQGGGLREALLDERANAGDYIDANVFPNLSVLYSGGATPHAHELLARARFSEIISLYLRDYDATIVDTPPANTSADARLVSNAVGYSLIVTRKDKTLMADLKTLVQQLESDRATVVGTILNEF